MRGWRRGVDSISLPVKRGVRSHLPGQLSGSDGQGVSREEGMIVRGSRR
jgi:hypothetical protein